MTHLPLSTPKQLLIIFCKGDIVLNKRYSHLFSSVEPQFDQTIPTQLR
jgi:hypothetical protein